MWTEVGGTQLSPRQPLRRRKLTSDCDLSFQANISETWGLGPTGSSCRWPSKWGALLREVFRLPLSQVTPALLLLSLRVTDLERRGLISHLLLPCPSPGTCLPLPPLRVALWLPSGLGLGGTPAYSLAPSPLTEPCQVS